MVQLPLDKKNMGEREKRGMFQQASMATVYPPVEWKKGHSFDSGKDASSLVPLEQSK